MKITITSKKHDAKTGVSTTRERGLVVTEFGKFLRYAMLKEENEYAGAVADAARALRVPKGKIRKAVGEYVLDLFGEVESDVVQKSIGDIPHAIEITAGDEEGGHDIDSE